MKLQALRSEMRLLILLAVIANQTLFRLNLTGATVYTVSGIGVVAAVVLKLFWI